MYPKRGKQDACDSLIQESIFLLLLGLKFHNEATFCSLSIDPKSFSKTRPVIEFEDNQPVNYFSDR